MQVVEAPVPELLQMREWTSIEDSPEGWDFCCEGLTKDGRTIDVEYHYSDEWGDTWYPDDIDEYKDPDFSITHWRPYPKEYR